MSERKVINKYYPPDFDPSKIVKKKKKVKTGSASMPTVRFMTPYSLRCENCGEYTSKARKFNARKETTSETYLGTRTIKLHIKCPRCASEIIFRTDPKSADYVLMYGAKKLYDTGNTNQVLKDETLEETLKRLEREEQEAKQKELDKDKKTTTVEELEAKLNDIRRQQNMNDELQDIQQRNAKLETDSKKIQQRKLEEERVMQRLRDEEDERQAQQAFKGAQTEDTMGSSDDSDYEPIKFDNPAPKIIVKKKTNQLGVKKVKL